MSRSFVRSLLSLVPSTVLSAGVALLLVTSTAWAQLPAARLTAVAPSGAKQGASVEVTITGSDLDDVNKLHFSHPGIVAVQKTTPAGPLDKAPQPVANQFTVAVAADVPIGIYECRAIGRYGISTSRAFTVGDLPESNEEEGNNTLAQAKEVALNSTINGASNANSDIDYYKFKVAKGQRVLVNCWAQRIDSRMDGTLAAYDPSGKEVAFSRDVNRRDPFVDFVAATEGMYTVKVYDFVYGGGAEYFYRLTIGTGPHIDYIFPPSGVAGTTGKFTLYGRNLPGGTPADGLKVDNRPLEKLAVDVALPGGAAQQQLALSGLIESEASGMDGFEYRFKGASGSSNPVLIGFAAAPVVVEKEPNNDAKTAQKVAVPCEFVGQFQARRDNDWIAFDAKKGDVYSLEVVSQRQGVPSDPQMIVQQVTVNEKGEETVKDLQEADDLAVNLGGISFDTRSDDPTYRFVAPADGLYRVMVADLYQRGDPRYIYRLAIRTETPDYRLVAVPQYFTNQQNQNKVEAGVCLVRKGGNTAINILAFRRDGFDGEITVAATGLPAGVTCPEVMIGAGQTSATMVFTAADTAETWAGVIQINGKAKIAGADAVREARGGSVVWAPVANQQNARAESRLTRNIALAVSSAEAAPFQVEVAEAKVYEMSRAGKLEIPLKITRRGDFKGAVAIVSTPMPSNMKINNFNIDAGKGDAKLQVDVPNNAPLGTYTFTLVGTSQVSYARNPEAVKEAEAAKKPIDQALAAMNDEAKKLTQAKTDADKAATDAAAEAKKTADAKAAAEKKSAEAEAASKAAAEKAKTAAEGDKAAADKAAADAAAKAKEAVDALLAATKAADDAAAKVKTTADAKVAADKSAAESAEKVKMATAAQAAADKRVKDAAALVKANNVNVTEPSTPVFIRITAAPITLPTPAQPAKVKQGEKVEVTVAINRLYDYKDPVELEFTLPKDSKGLKIAKVTVAKDQSEAKVTIEAAADATAGNHAVAIKGTAKFNGQNLTADQTLPVEVEAAAAAATK